MDASVIFVHLLTSNDFNDKHCCAVAMMEVSVIFSQPPTFNDVNKGRCCAVAMMEASVTSQQLLTSNDFNEVVHWFAIVVIDASVIISVQALKFNAVNEEHCCAVAMTGGICQPETITNI